MKRWHGIAGAVVGLFMIVWLVQAIRGRAVANERIRVMDSTAKVTQRDRARILAKGTADSTLAVSLGFAVDRLTREADSARQRARDARRDAERAKVQRDAAIARLTGSQTPADSLAALLGKSEADDSVIAAQGRAIEAGGVEIRALRSALDSGDVARTILTSALDSARAQLRRDGQVIQGLQAVLQPQRAPRFAKLALSVGVGYCAAPSLTPRFCAAVVAGPSLRVF